LGEFEKLPFATMPILTTTIEDTSPMIIYSGSSGSDWIAGTSADPLADL
jgi:hypothetical protein